jgi:hypothetical protein
MDSPGTLNPELLVQNTRRLLSRIASPSLFVALDRPVSPRKKSDTGHQIKAATPIIIDLTGISDDGDDIPTPARPPSTSTHSRDTVDSRFHRTYNLPWEDFYYPMPINETSTIKPRVDTTLSPTATRQV